MSGLRYRAIGATGDEWPDWVRALVGRSGVYVVRRRRDGRVLYVGESHAGRLYGTITRHFQRWSRRRESYVSHTRATGAVYNRGDVEVAVRVTSDEAAPLAQYRLIARLSPRDNEIEGVALFADEKDEDEAEEVPF